MRALVVLLCLTALLWPQAVAAQWGVGVGAGPLLGGGNLPTGGLGGGLQAHVRYSFFTVFSAGIGTGVQTYSAPGYDAVADRSFRAANTLIPFTGFLEYALEQYHVRPYVQAELGAVYVLRNYTYAAGSFGAPSQNTINLLVAPVVGMRVLVKPQLWLDANVRYCIIPNGKDLLSTLPLSVGIVYTFASHPNHYLQNLKPKTGSTVAPSGKPVAKRPAKKR